MQTAGQWGPIAPRFSLEKTTLARGTLLLERPAYVVVFEMVHGPNHLRQTYPAPGRPIIRLGSGENILLFLGREGRTSATWIPVTLLAFALERPVSQQALDDVLARVKKRGTPRDVAMRLGPALAIKAGAGRWEGFMLGVQGYPEQLVRP